MQLKAVFSGLFLFLWEAKILYLIHREQRKLTTTEMADLIHEYEPWRERSKIVGSISAVLSQKSKEGGIFTKDTDIRGNFIYSIKQEEDNDLPF